MKEETVVDLELAVCTARLCVSYAADAGQSALSAEDVELRARIESLVESMRGDGARSAQLFQYVWTMACVRRGLMRVVREVPGADSTQLVLEEVRSGQRRFVARPKELDSDLEVLAVSALTHLLHVS